MSRQQLHLERSEQFETAAGRVSSPPAKVEMLFLAAYHLIDACAAKHRIHIDKHQRVRRELEANVEIFGERTAEVWRAFQRIEKSYRPKFVYGASGTEDDLREVQRLYDIIRETCLEVLG